SRRPKIFNIRLTQCVTGGFVLGLTKSSLTLAICKARNATHRVISAHSVPHRIGKNCAQEPYRTGSSASTSANASKSSGPRFGAVGRLACSDVVQKGFDIFPCHRAHGATTQQRFDVP